MPPLRPATAELLATLPPTFDGVVAPGLATAAVTLGATLGVVRFTLVVVDVILDAEKGGFGGVAVSFGAVEDILGVVEL